MVREGRWTEKQLYPNKKSWKQNRFFYPLMFQFPLLKVFPILLWSVLCRHRWYSILGSTQSHRTGNLENLIICCKNYICHHQKSKLLLHFQDFHFLIDLRINLKSNIWRATIWFQNLARTSKENQREKMENSTKRLIISLLKKSFVLPPLEGATTHCFGPNCKMYEQLNHKSPM